MSDAARLINGYLRILRRALPAVKQGRSPEPLHRLRVAINRAQNAFWIFKKDLSKKHLLCWVKDLKNLSRCCGKARDLDAQIGFVKKYSRTLKDDRDRAVTAMILRRLHARRKQAQKDLRPALSGFEKRGDFFAGQRICSQKTLDALARKRIGQRCRALLKFDRVVAHPKRVRQLHRMRVAVKDVRYTLEAFWLLDGKKVGKRICELVALQDALGQMHDLDVWFGSFTALFPKPSRGQQAALVRLVGFCRAKRKAAYRRMVRIWAWQKRSGFLENLKNK